MLHSFPFLAPLPIFSQTHDIFVIIGREEGEAPWAEVCGYSPLCIMDSLRLYRVIALLEWGWGVDWGFLFSQQLLLHHQSRVTIFSSSRCMAAALAQDGDQNLGWGVIFFLCLSRQQDEHQLRDLVLLPFTCCRRICRCKRTQCLRSHHVLIWRWRLRHSGENLF